MPDDKKKGEKQESEQKSLLPEMVLHDGKNADSDSGLVVEPNNDDGAEKDSFDKQLEETLLETEQAVLSVAGVGEDSDQARGWELARKIVEDFRPVPFFIWRLSNYVIGSSSKVSSIQEGMVFGLRRLLFAAASDPVLGVGEKVNDVHRALRELDPNIVAAVSVVHAVCRRLAAHQFERIWRPILDDALLRARIGILVTESTPDFGAGRGMLAGFSGRCGLAVLIATGDLDQARRALEKLATGAPLREVGLSIYSCDPLQVSAMILSAAGCGRDAAFGTVSYATPEAMLQLDNEMQEQWLAAFAITEGIRTGKIGRVSEAHWQRFHCTTPQARQDLADEAKKIVRRGHTWNWLAQ